MKPPRIYLVAIISLMLSLFCTAQTIDEESNWYKEIGRRDDSYSRFDFTRYSRTDVVRTKDRFLRIESTAPVDEWEGVYTSGTAVGEAEFRWRKSSGYAYHSVYHTLSSVDHGTVGASRFSIWLVSRRSKGPIRSPLFRERLVKVKVGVKHYLVPESKLKDFAERVVGRETTHLNEWNHWQRIDELDVEVSGLPTYPPKHSNLVLKPIETTIQAVGFRKINLDRENEGTIKYGEVLQFVTLADGANKQIKVGMDFFVPDLGEWIKVIKVNPNSAEGQIRRDVGENQAEECRNLENGWET